MIVVTGPGRSGTSLLARLYKELGFDPGGWWQSEVNAGFEHKDVWALNVKVARSLGVSAGERRGGRLLEGAGYFVGKSEGHVSERIRRPIARAVDVVRYLRSQPDLMDFEHVDRVALRYGAQMRALAKDLPVVKDPQFCFTLHAWLAAGAPVEAVVLTLRPLDALADSRVRANMYMGRARDWARHNYCYGLGLLLTATAENRVPVSMLRFPDFLADPDELRRNLPMPEARTPEEFERAFCSVYDPSLVHDHR
ncbi:MAG: hypothetical protein ACRD6W_18795 [Nitrososphaerales archaeon]